MREIKFRAFYDGNIYDVTEIHWSDETAYVVEQESWGDPVNGQTVGFNHIELMQWIGLHDKNGKEIYEGDILKESDNELVFEVKYNERSGAYKMPPEYDEEYTFSIGDIPTDVEVIGNIYENPALLKA